MRNVEQTREPIAVLSTREVAAQLHTDRRGVRRLIDAGRLTPAKLPGRTGAWVFDPADVDRLAAERAS